MKFDDGHDEAYSSQSGGVVEMLTKLEDEFKEKKAEVEKEELGAQKTFAQIIQQLSDNIENAEHEINKKETLRWHHRDVEQPP